MILAAQALGVQSLFTTFFGLVEPVVKEILHVPPRMFLEAAVFLGYGAEQLGRPRRRPLAETVHLNDWSVHSGRNAGGAFLMRETGEIPKIVSADDHVVEPASVWQDRLPSKYKDVGPRVVRAPAEMSFFGGKFTHRMGGDGPPADWWLYEDLSWPHTRLGACAGYEPEEVRVEPITYDEMRPGCFEQEPRLEDMDVNWVEASLCFPTFPRFCGQTFYEAKDKELALLCVKAYNDWMVEEWCAGSGGRLIPLALIPLWDPHGRRRRGSAQRGARGCGPCASASSRPIWASRPSTTRTGIWDPFVAACDETGHRYLHAQRLGIEDALDLGGRPARSRIDPHPRAGRAVAGGLVVLRDAGSLSRPGHHLLRRPDRVDPLHSRAGRTGSGSTTGAGTKSGT